MLDLGETGHETTFSLPDIVIEWAKHMLSPLFFFNDFSYWKPQGCFLDVGESSLSSHWKLNQEKPARLSPQFLLSESVVSLHILEMIISLVLPDMATDW